MAIDDDRDDLLLDRGQPNGLPFEGSSTPPYAGPRGQDPLAIELDETALPPRPVRAPAVGMAMPELAGSPARRSWWKTLGAVIVVGLLLALGYGLFLHLPAETPPPPVAEPVGSLTVTSTPPGALVWIDGRERGAAPVTVLGLRAGAHQVRLTLEGRESVQTRVRVEANSLTEYEAELLADLSERATGVLVLRTDAPAEVFFRGRSLGQTPLSGVRLPEGTIELELIAAGGQRQRLGVVIRANQVTTSQATLSP